MTSWNLLHLEYMVFEDRSSSDFDSKIKMLFRFRIGVIATYLVMFHTMQCHNQMHTCEVKSEQKKNSCILTFYLIINYLPFLFRRFFFFKSGSFSHRLRRDNGDIQYSNIMQ